MQEEELTVDVLRALATRADLKLSDEELEAVMPGVKRNLAMAQTVRKWLAPSIEPSSATLVPRLPV